jgi:hypothetical protein
MGRRFPLLASCLGCPLKTGAIVSGVYGIVNNQLVFYKKKKKKKTTTKTDSYRWFICCAAAYPSKRPSPSRRCIPLRENRPF